MCRRLHFPAAVPCALPGRRKAYPQWKKGWMSTKPPPSQTGARTTHSTSTFCTGRARRRSSNFSPSGSGCLRHARTNDGDFLGNLEAPPGFEPGMEVLQTDGTNENRPEIAGFRPVLPSSIGWREVESDPLLTAFDHTRDHSWVLASDSPPTTPTISSASTSFAVIQPLIQRCCFAKTANQYISALLRFQAIHSTTPVNYSCRRGTADEDMIDASSAARSPSGGCPPFRNSSDTAAASLLRPSR
jgi:hypothetical protein